jgi:hypothetical protein
MEKILNSIEELYQLISGTLPDGYVERIPKVNWDMIGGNDVYGREYYANSYFQITDTAFHNHVKIEYGTRSRGCIIANARIYKYA